VSGSALAIFYRAFRVRGLTAHQAYAAAFCAVRVAKFTHAEFPTWAFLFRRRSTEQTADIRRALAHIPPQR
jgi:hypothetical protein